MWRTKREYWTWMITLFLGCCTVYIGRMAMPTCEVAIAEEFGWNEEQLGRVLSAFFWGYASTQIVGGALADAYGGAKTIAWSSFIWGSICILTPMLTSFAKSVSSACAYYTFIVLRVALGVSQAVHFPSLTALLSKNVSPEERAFAFSFTGGGSNIGTLVCGYFGSTIAQNYGWQTMFALCGVCGLAFSSALFKLEAGQSTDYEALSPAESVKLHDKKGVSLLQNSFREAASLCRKLIKKKPFQVLILAQMVNSYTGYGITFWTPKYFHDEFPHLVDQKYYTSISFISTPGSLVFAMISDHLVSSGKLSTTNARRYIQFFSCMTGAAIAYNLTFTGLTIYSALFLTMCLLVAISGHQAAACVNPQDLVPQNSGVVFGVMNTAGALAASIGIWFCGWLLETYHDWTLIFWSFCLLHVVSGVLYLTFGTAKRLL